MRMIVMQFYHSWNLSSEHKEDINIDDNSTYPYAVNAYCHGSSADCIYATEFTNFNVSKDLNGSNLSCIESGQKHGVNPISQVTFPISK